MKNTILIIMFLLVSLLMNKNIYSQNNYDYVYWDFTQKMDSANYSSDTNHQNLVKHIYYNNINVSPITFGSVIRPVNDSIYYKTYGWDSQGHSQQKFLSITITPKNNYILPNINSILILIKYTVNNGDTISNSNTEFNITQNSNSIKIEIRFLKLKHKDIVNIYTLSICGDIPLPITLKSFNYNIIKNSVKLSWTTENEINNDKFEIYRNNIKIGEIKGNGTKTSTSAYEFYDKNLQVGDYVYKLKQIDYNNNFEWFDLSAIVHINVSNKSNIEQNYPNPFNSSTKINYTVYKNSFIKIKIFDILGKEIKTLLNEYKQSGYYSIEFDALNFPSGIYYYSFETDNIKIIKKMILIK